MRWILFMAASVAAAVTAYLVGRRASSTSPSPLPAAPPVSAPPQPKRKRLRLISLILLWGVVGLLALTFWTRTQVPEMAVTVPVVAPPIAPPTVAPTLAPGALPYQLAWPIGTDSPASGHGWFGDADWRQDGYLSNDGVIRGGSELFALAQDLHPVIDDADYSAEI